MPARLSCTNQQNLARARTTRLIIKIPIVCTECWTAWSRCHAASSSVRCYLHHILRFAASGTLTYNTAKPLKILHLAEKDWQMVSNPLRPSARSSVTSTIPISTLLNPRKGNICAAICSAYRDRRAQPSSQPR